MDNVDLSFIKNRLETLPAGNREKCLQLFEDEQVRFSKAMGSSKKHHAFEGGYAKHIADTMRIAGKLYDSLNEYSLPFILQDVYLVLFLHDLEKAWKYSEPRINVSKEEAEAFRQQIISDYEIELTDDHKNALRHIEIEKDYNPHIRKQGPLAAFCHSCDNLSARLFYNGI